MRRAPHQGDLGADFVADPLQLRLALGPRDHIHMAAHRPPTVRVCFVQILFDPLPVYGIRARVTRQRVHIARSALKRPQDLFIIVQEDILIQYVAASQQQSHG